jgi:hypothetical protein
MDAESLKNALVRLEKYLMKAKLDEYMKCPIVEISLTGGEDADMIQIDFLSERLKSLTIGPDGRATVDILQEIEL